MSPSKNKCLYSNNCLHFLKRAVPLYWMLLCLRSCFIYYYGECNLAECCYAVLSAANIVLKHDYQFCELINASEVCLLGRLCLRDKMLRHRFLFILATEFCSFNAKVSCHFSHRKPAVWCLKHGRRGLFT